MSQRVPNWEVEDSNDSARLPFHDASNSHPISQHLLQHAKCGADYEVTELTWENGHLAMHGLGGKEKPTQGGTLESIVRQAAGLPPTAAKAGEELMPWLAQQRGTVLAMDALVPCSHQTLSAEDLSTRVPGSGGSPPVLSSARVGSCSASREDGPGVRKRSRVVTSIDVQSESRPTTMDSTEFSPDSPTNTDDPDTSSYLSRPQRVSGGREDGKMKKSLGRSRSSIKRSRAAAIHNQSERKRRDRINQRMKTLQKLVPNASKTDKASMLDEVIEYLKQLQAQVQMISKISTFPSMMMPMAMQPMAMQQMQMAMMAQMGMGFGMGMGMGVMDMNTLARTSQPASLPQVVHPPPAASTTAFLPMSTPWEGFTDRFGVPGPVAGPGTMMSTDSLAAFLTGQAHAQAQPPMTLDTYSRLAMFYQQLHPQTGPPHHSRT